MSAARDPAASQPPSELSITKDADGLTVQAGDAAMHHQPDLFTDNERNDRLSPLVDRINRKFGRNTISFGQVPANVQKFNGHAAFQRVPESWEF